MLTVIDSLHWRPLRLRHQLLRLFAKSLEVCEDRGEQGNHRFPVRPRLREPKIPKLLVLHTRYVVVLRVHHKRRIAQVVGAHDTGIQGRKVERCDWRVIRTGLRLQYRRALIAVVGRWEFRCPDGWNHKVELSSLVGHLAENLDLLTSLAQKRQGDPTRLGHLNLVLDLAQLHHQLVRKDRVLYAVVSNLPEALGVALQVSAENLLDRHVVFLVIQKVFGDVVQRVRLELVLALDVLKEVEDVSALHWDHLELVVAERTRAQVLLDQLDDRALHATPDRAQSTMNRRADQQVLEVKAKDVPARDNVRVGLDQVFLESFEEFLLRLEALAIGRVRLFEAQTLAFERFLAAKCAGRHSNLEHDIRGPLGVRETTRARITLNIEGHNLERRKVIAIQRCDEAPIRCP